MNRKNSPGILIALLLGLFLLGGCGNNTEQGVIEAGGGTVALAAADTTVAEGNSTILTASVTVTRKDSKGVYVTDHYPGQEVTFVIISNQTGATVTPTNGGITNADGVATAVYTAGKLKKGLVVQDTVQAHIAGYSGQVVITRTGVESGYTIALTATPTSVAAGQNAVVTATVTATNPEGGTGVPVSGQFVSFSFVANNSGGSLATVNGVTDASGKATATYTAGNNDSEKSLTDTIQASSGGSTASVVIGRSTGTDQPLAISVTATPDSVAAGGTSVITATLTGDYKSGVTIQFLLMTNSSGATLTRATAVTDGDGNAVTIYQAGSNNPTADVVDVVQVISGSASSAVNITRTAGMLAAYKLEITASPTSVTVPNGGGPFSVVLTVQVTDQNGNPRSGVTVNITPAPPGPAATVVTGADGKGVVAYTSSASSGAIVFTAQAPALNISGSTAITVTEMP